MIAGTALWIAIVIAASISAWGIASVLRISADQFTAAGYRRRNWVLLMLLVGPMAVLFFFATVRYHVLYPERYRTVDGVAPADR